MSQETDLFKNMVRQHLDLKAIETKLQKGSYSSCNLLFYRDLLLLFTNATIFFPKPSLESIAAHEFRQLVLKELKNTRPPRPDPSSEPSDSLPPTSPSHAKRPELETSDLFLPKTKPNVPIIVCRKRSSISSKPASSSFSQKEEQQSDEKKPALDLKPPVINPKEKPVTGTRSSRRSKENVTNSSAAPTKKQTSSSTSLAKMEKKKPEALAIEKKRSAADFLKRIKRNSRGEGSGGGDQKESYGKVEKGKERVLRPNGDRKAASQKEKEKEKSSPSKRSVGRPPKKAAETNAVSAKRSREGGGKETSKRPRKRSRR